MLGIPKNPTKSHVVLEDVVENVLCQVRWKVKFNHAGVERIATVDVGWEKIRLLETGQVLWVLVVEKIEGEEAGRWLVLGTNMALINCISF
jgi:hypothetical protein